jgi:hypothetical protein
VIVMVIVVVSVSTVLCCYAAVLLCCCTALCVSFVTLFLSCGLVRVLILSMVEDKR